MERIDLDNWKAREVARLLTLVENDRRYYQEILTCLPIPVAIVSRELNLAMINRAFRWTFQLKHEDLGDKRLDDIIRVPLVRERVVQAFESNSPEAGIKFSRTGPDGARKNHRLTVIPLWDAYQDRPQEAIVVIEEPEQAASTASKLLDELGAVVWQSDARTGEVAFGNRAAAELLDGSASQWADRVHPEDAARVAWVYEAVTETGKDATVEYRGAKSEGLWLCDRIHPVVEGGKVVMLEVMTTDESERHRRANQLLQLSEIDSTMQLAQQVAHEFNNLWMIVTGYSEVLAERVEEDPESRSGLEAILKAAERGVQSTAQLLQFGRPPTAHPRAVDLHGLIRSWNLDAEARFEEEPLGASVDPGKLEAILRGFVQYVSEREAGGGRVYIKTERESLISDTADRLPKGQFAAIRVGPVGKLSAALERHWCQPYFTEADKPLSIGPAVWNAQLRQMGGWARLERTGESTGEFVLLFPVAKLAEPERKAVEAEAKPVVEAAKALETILVVDDEESIRNLVARVLVRQGYEVLVAESGEEGLRLAETYEGAIALVVTDVMLPGMRGPEMASRVRRLRPEIRVLYISGYMDDPDLAAGILTPGEGFLQKPFTLTALAQTVRTVLDVKSENIQ